MDYAEIIDLFREAIYVCVLLVGVIVLPALVVGLIISMIQAATQINEQTLSFIPRLFVVFFVISVLGPWMIKQLVNFTESLYHNINSFLT